MILPLPGHVPLALTTRGGALENLHWGSLAVVAADGTWLASSGDGAAAIFARSTIKPFQALPLVAAGGLERYGWSDEAVALLCASHSAEDVHLRVVRAMLESFGADEQALGCGPHVPMLYAATGAQPPQTHWTALHNNCSGKHAGFLACCDLHGWSAPDYLTYAHPLQAAVRAALSTCSGCDVEAQPHGIDGCSAPNYALPLAALARAMARLGSAQGEYAAPLARLRDAMRAHPLLVSGTARFDLLLAQAGQGDWLAKVGADGVQVLASISRGVGIAIKLADGNARVLNTVCVDLLRQLGWLDAGAAAALAAWAQPAIHNWRGEVTGEVRPCLQLTRH
jgi:L-asparaginase II